MLLESAPGHAEVPAVRDRIGRVEGVAAVHDLHVWTIGSGTHALSAHVVLEDRKLSEASAILRSIDATLRDEFEITHVTVQFECESCDPDTTDRVHADPSGIRRRFREVCRAMKPGTVVLSTARTPFGRLGGALASLAATTLGADAIRNALARAGIDPSDVEHVIMGQVIQAGAGQAPARQAAFKAGLAKTTTAETVNKVCASGMLAVVHAARTIGDGDNRVVVAGGMESMSNAPYLLPGARNGYRIGNADLVDAMINDGLWDYYFDEAMASQGARRRRARRDPRRAGRVRVPEPPARARCARGGRLRRGDRADQRRHQGEGQDRRRCAAAARARAHPGTGGGR